MSNFDNYIEILEEGIFSAEKVSKKLRGKTQEEVNQKLQDFLSQYKEYNPKPSGMGGKYKIKTDRSGFYIDVTHDEVKAAEDTSVKGLAKRAGKALARGYRAATDTDVKVTGTANSKEALNQTIEAHQNKIKHKFPDAKFMGVKSKVLPNGKVEYEFYYKRARTKEEVEGVEKEPKKKVVKKPSAAQDEKTVRISNVQKQLSKLSDENLKKIEDWLIKVKVKQ